MTRTILIADANDTTARVVQLMLATQDIEVLKAHDGQDALEVMASRRPDLVLVDANSEPVDGYELARRVADTPTLSGIPVVVMVGPFDRIDHDRLASSGAAGTLVKPIDPDALFKRLRESTHLPAPHSDAAQPDRAQGAAASVQPPQPQLSGEALDMVAAKVLERLSDRQLPEAVHRIVAEVSERMVRDEIARIRAEAEARQRE